MKRMNNPSPATLPFGQEVLPALDVWTRTIPSGTKAEYRYHQSKTGTGASRKVGDSLDTVKRVFHGLTRKQVEALFAKRRYNP
jgi:hypothetical protein